MRATPPTPPVPARFQNATAQHPGAPGLDVTGDETSRCVEFSGTRRRAADGLRHPPDRVGSVARAASGLPPSVPLSIGTGPNKQVLLVLSPSLSSSGAKLRNPCHTPNTQNTPTDTQIPYARHVKRCRNERSWPEGQIQQGRKRERFHQARKVPCIPETRQSRPQAGDPAGSPHPFHVSASLPGYWSRSHPDEVAPGIVAVELPGSKARRRRRRSATVVHGIPCRRLRGSGASRKRPEV